MTRNLKKLICVLLAVMLVGVASAMVFAEISKSTDEPSATPVDKTADCIDISAPVDDIKVQPAPIKVKDASIKEASPFPKDATVCSLDNMNEPVQVLMPIGYGMMLSTCYMPKLFEIPDNNFSAFTDMLEGLEFIPVTGDEMVAEAKEATLNKDYETVSMWIYYEEGDVMLDVTFYRSKENAVWLPYFRSYDAAVNMTTDEYNEEVENLKGQSWETGLYMINPETMDVQVLETVTSMALGCSLDEYIDFDAELGDLLQNNRNPNPIGNNGESKYGDYSYYMERFPYASIPFEMIHFS